MSKVNGNGHQAHHRLQGVEDRADRLEARIDDHFIRVDDRLDTFTSNLVELSGQVGGLQALAKVQADSQLQVTATLGAMKADLAKLTEEKGRGKWAWGKILSFIPIVGAAAALIKVLDWLLG